MTVFELKCTVVSLIKKQLSETNCMHQTKCLLNSSAGLGGVDL